MSQVAAMLVVALLPTVGWGQADVKLPPESKRKVLGSWLVPMSYDPPCAFAFEQVGTKVFEVFRCANGEGGTTGTQLKRIAPDKFAWFDDSPKKYRQILPNGDLSIRDREGEIHRIPSFRGLWPTKDAKPGFNTPAENRVIPLQTNESEAESSKTVGVPCKELGFRFGYVAGLAAAGKKGKPEWDFAKPPRCKLDQEFDVAIKSGLAAAKE